MQNTKISSQDPRYHIGKRLRFRFALLPALLLSIFVTFGCGDDDEGTPAGPVTWTVSAAGGADFQDIQSCINDARNGDTCLVSAGTYGPIRFYGKGINVSSSSGADLTFLDALGQDTVVRFIDGEDRDSILNGFTVRNGSTSSHDSQAMEPSLLDLGNAEPGEENGGGIKIWVASPMIENCIIKNNHAEGDGGGVFCTFSGSRPEFLNVVFQENTANGQGGGLAAFSGLPDLKNCLFIGNNADKDNQDPLNRDRGGAISASYGADVLLSNCTLADNAAKTGGDALYLLNAKATLQDSISWGQYFHEDGDVFSGQLVLLDLDVEQGGSSEIALNYVDIEGREDGVVKDMENCTENRCSIVDDPAPVLIPEDPGADPDPVFTQLYEEEEKDAQVSMQAYYLSQVEAGQEEDSPCLDTGSESALEAGMSKRTTQNGDKEENGEHVQSPDTGTVDLGYHYALTYPEPEV